LSPELSMMVDRILDFPRQDVEHAMVPRSRVVAIESDETIGALRERMASGHSRYPVMEEGRIVGVAHLVDVLELDDVDAPVTSIMRPALVIPELMPLPNALAA
ncbi:CBS domain-containing protein, partial [Aeromicrobium phragmitis]